MNVLTLEDLLEVSMFKCKICRLQAPVLQIGVYGNVCGVCNERSIFTEVTHNADVETLLSKLYVPCNYKERGCTYDASYYNTCEHEKRCRFRDKVCPFAYVGECENELVNFHDITTHISNCHKDNVLMVKEDGTVDVQNPTETNRDIFYLLSVDNENFLLRTWIHVKGEDVFYAFYHFKDEINLKNNCFSIKLKRENTIYAVTGVDGTILHESVIGPVYNTDNTFRIPLSTLKDFNYLESVEISVGIDKDPVKPLSPVEDSNKSVWARCPCSKIVGGLYFCEICQTRKCTNCYSLNTFCACSSCNYFRFINFAELMLIYDIACENTGCNQILKPNEYDRHKEVCSFKQHVCPLDSQEKCKWKGLLENMAGHMNDEHIKLINQDVCEATTSKILYFIKGNSVFKQECNLDNNGDLSITTNKLTAPIWDDSYRWEVRIKRKDIPMIMVITDVCTEGGFKKTVNVKNYIHNNALTIYADIKRADIKHDVMIRQ